MTAVATAVAAVMTVAAVRAPKRGAVEQAAEHHLPAAPVQALTTYPLPTMALVIPTTLPAPSPTPRPTTRPRATTRPPVRTTTTTRVPPPAECSSSGWNTRPHVARVGHHIAARFGLSIGSILGRAARANASDHPKGLALDFMVGTATGDRLADYAMANRGEFAITYVIWKQRINHGSGWVRMEDRGGITANHYDHVHVSFAPSGGAGVAC